jgi:hypothetical protein
MRDDKTPPKMLSKDKNVYQVDDTVTRPAQPWSPSVLEFLTHLRSHNLPVEHFLTINENQEIYEYAEAELVHPNAWTDDALYEVGILLSKLHDIGAVFSPSKDLGVKAWYLREIGNPSPRIWCHGDFAPWNLLTKKQKPYLLIDWEFAGPLDPMIELARTCWLFAQLHDDDIAAMYALPEPQKRASQVRLICDAYGLDKRRRTLIPNLIIETIICETAHEAIDQSIKPRDYGPLWGLAWRARSLYWVSRHYDLLRRALS